MLLRRSRVRCCEIAKGGGFGRDKAFRLLLPSCRAVQGPSDYRKYLKVVCIGKERKTSNVIQVGSQKNNTLD